MDYVVVSAALQEDADLIAVSSYQGGHLEFFRYLIDRLREAGAGHIRVYGGGGGVISPDEVRLLHEYGVTRVFRPEDGQRIGLAGMIAQVLEPGFSRPEPRPEEDLARHGVESTAVARLMSFFEAHRATDGSSLDPLRQRLAARRRGPAAPLIGLHRYRRRGKVDASRRAGAPLPTRLVEGGESFIVDRGAGVDEKLPRRVHAHSATAAESTGAAASEAGQGRMKKKVLSAGEALEGGVKRVIIADGRVQNPISNALAGNGTVIQCTAL